MTSPATELPEEGTSAATPHAIANPFGRVLARFQWNPFHEMEPVSALMKPELIGEIAGPEASWGGSCGADAGVGVLTIQVPCSQAAQGPAQAGNGRPREGVIRKALRSS